MLSVSITGADAVEADLAALPERVRMALQRELTALSAELASRVRDKLSGEVLAVRSGLLRDSVVQETGESGSNVYGRVAVEGVPYAAIHEFGGHTPAHAIAARKVRALHFVAGGKEVFSRRVQHPGSRMPERSYLRATLAAMEAEIAARLQAAVAEAL